MSDDFGDRMKLYENMESARRLTPLLPVMARIDGRSFSKFTRNMRRPYDERLSKLMIATTKYLVQETVACAGYTQSDEISLGWLQTSYNSEILFSGRIQKMVSQLAAMATGYFVANYQNYFGELPEGYPSFDCRVWNVPNIEEGANVFLWREMDASKNSISMAARTLFSHKELMNKSGQQMQEMMWQKGVNWNDYPSFFKRGTFVQKRTEIRKYTSEEIAKLPKNHEARSNPELEVSRSKIVSLELPPFGKVTNRPQVIFFGENPKTNN